MLHDMKAERHNALDAVFFAPHLLTLQGVATAARAIPNADVPVFARLIANFGNDVNKRPLIVAIIDFMDVLEVRFRVAIVARRFKRNCLDGRLDDI